MIKCPFCQTTHVDNTIFCSECGHYLLKKDSRETDPVGLNEISELSDPKNDPTPDPSLRPGTGPLSIRLRINDREREVEAVLNKVICLGRVDPTSDIFPEIDLTNEATQAQGVSRRHARIFKQEGKVMVEDLDSTNGTFINGRRLDPYLAEMLSDGDILQLGQLLMEIKIRRP